MDSVLVSINDGTRATFHAQRGRFYFWIDYVNHDCWESVHIPNELLYTSLDRIVSA